MFLLFIFLSLATASNSEPDDVIIQVLYKPKDCKDIGRHGDVMHVQYLGRFFDTRKTFDSSYRRNNVPFYYTLGVGGVIEGYQIGTKNMCINERRRLIVPSKYAYGNKGTDNIPGYSTLMFDVHLVQINKSPPSYPVPIDLPKETISEGNQSCQNPIKIGDLVEITFIGSLPDGKVFDNGTMTPLKFILGSGQILKGIEEGLVNFCKESNIIMEIPPAKAYGDRWEGQVPQWSYVYYNVTVTKHIVRDEIEDGDASLQCENLHIPSDCDTGYKVQAGDYVELSYKVFNKEKEILGDGEIRYPVGRKVIVPGWDVAILGSCVSQLKMCWIPSSLAHKMGTSLFLAIPEKGFFSELVVTKILLTADSRDSVDLLDGESKASGNIVNANNGPTITKTVLDTAPTHTEL